MVAIFSAGRWFNSNIYDYTYGMSARESVIVNKIYHNMIALMVTDVPLLMKQWYLLYDLLYDKQKLFLYGLKA